MKISNILNKLKKFLFEDEEEEIIEEIGDVTYAAIELHPLADEYALPDDYLPETLYVIKYYRGTEVIGIEPYSESRVKQLQKYMPVIWRVKRTLADKFMMENVIRFEM